MVAQWLRLHTSNVGDTGSIFGQGTKIPYTAWSSQKKKKKRKLEIEKELPEQRFGKDLEMERAWFEEQGGRQCV